MSTLQKIEEDIQELPRNQVTELRVWIEEYEASLWDMQIKEESKNGKLSELTAKAMADFKAGKCTKM